MKTVENAKPDSGDKSATPPKETVQEDAFGEFDEPVASGAGVQENDDGWGGGFGDDQAESEPASAPDQKTGTPSKAEPTESVVVPEVSQPAADPVHDLVPEIKPEENGEDDWGTDF